MPTNTQIISFLSQYAIVLFLGIGGLWYAAHTLLNLTDDLKVECVLADVHEGQQIQFRKHNGIITRVYDWEYAGEANIAIKYEDR